jgi:tetratricopeptide (TPR) repeat protein
MIHSSKFWIGMVVFQVVFGLTVFALTRQYYLPGEVKTNAVRSSQPAAALPMQSEASDLANLISAFPGPAAVTDPVELSRQADEAFVNQQFGQAAELYERLLLADPGNADTYNNLGLTLHYLGQTSEALRVLNEGVAVYPGYQRIWLTLGFVNIQAGNLDQARSALNTAVHRGADTEVGQSAAHMLDAL